MLQMHVFNRSLLNLHSTIFNFSKTYRFICIIKSVKNDKKVNESLQLVNVNLSENIH